MRLSLKYAAVAAAASIIGVIAYAARPRLTDVATVAVRRGKLRVTVSEEGVTRVRTHQDVNAPVTGRFVPSGVRVGDRVTRGAVLGAITPAPLDAESRRQAVARATAADAALREAEARLVASESALQEGVSVVARRERLAASGAIAREDLERARTSTVALSQDRDAAAARVAAVHADAAGAHAVLDVRATGSGTAVTVTAPLTGVVLRLAEEHERVVPAGTPLAEVGDPSDVEVVVPLLTGDAVRVARGAEMRITTSAGGDTLLARVTVVEPAAFTKLSPLGVEEQRVNVIGRFEKPVTGLGDAFRVDAAVTLAEFPDVVIVPTSGLVRAGTSWAAFVVTNGRAVRRNVALGARSADGAEVRAGLVAGDVVVAYPPEDLTDRARVRVTRQAAPIDG